LDCLLDQTLQSYVIPFYWLLLLIIGLYWYMAELERRGHKHRRPARSS
jgi:hypothetical protein